MNKWIEFDKSGNTSYDFPFDIQTQLIDKPLNFPDGTRIEFETEADVRSFFSVAFLFRSLINGYLTETHSTEQVILKTIELAHLHKEYVKFTTPL